MITHAARARRRRSRARRARRCRASTAAVVDEDDGEEVDADTQGLLVAAPAVAGDAAHALQDDDRFIETYFAKFGTETYLVGDAARSDDDGYFWVIGRVDDVINVSGHRMSTAEVESAIVSHPKVAEAAVIGQADEDTGQSIAAFVTLEGDLRGHRRARSPRSASTSPSGSASSRGPKRIIWADDLPKTRSGKIMRRLLRDIAEGRELGDVTTLRDPDVMAQLEEQDQGAPGRGRASSAPRHLRHGRRRRDRRAITQRLCDDGGTCWPSTSSPPRTARACRSRPTLHDARGQRRTPVAARRSSASAASTPSCPTPACSTSRPVEEFRRGQVGPADQPDADQPVPARACRMARAEARASRRRFVAIASRARARRLAVQVAPTCRPSTACWAW